jgi:hypothetical protein
MTNFSVSSLDACPADTKIWDQLKQAIAISSGFQRWQLECSLSGRLQGIGLEHQVRHYLRETLEMLSY